ncbi:MAG TPA: signal recognition particle-docking protein FtsY, partial [Acidimicrobiales bacterium]|nr:signal recognition particle-docking protein FtsY [Acidimicrobiales bacterium]
MEVLILLVAVLVVAGLAAAFLITRRRGGVELEPPAPKAPPVTTLEAPEVAEAAPEMAPEAAPEVVVPVERPRFRDRLTKARGAFAGFLGRTTIDATTWDELEDA